ncbi:nitrate reductase [Neptunomonas phycophila]|uniref:nitrate reductase n=1 Tax=Neptunomonas phycophila TaxID=1572645 RepID=UPI000948FE6C|nr:nitrate reductase [Neptunomonas phycophila]
MTSSIVKTTCPYCGVGCGVDAKLENGNLIAVSGTTDHPANYGKLCVKGSSLHETVDHEGRMLTPMLHGQPTDWDTSLAYVSDKIKAIVAEHGPDAFAFYVSGQILTEDYYVANKLIKGFIGTANIDTNSRLCMASAVVAHKRAFGTDTVPGNYDDLNHADLVILTGSNLAWAHPIVYQRLANAKKQNPSLQVVVIDPRKTASCDIADLHLPLKPGSDAFLFNGLAHHLIAHNKLDDSFLANHCNGLEAIQQTVINQTSQQTAQDCDLTEDQINHFYSLFANNERVVTLFSQGINQSSSGVDKGNAIINCHLLTGKIGKPGAAPFSITGQPNAMGGREVGGLANQLAAHMDFKKPEHIDRVARFWNATNMAKNEGLKAVDMFDAVADGRIKAIWIMATNPVVSMPDADRIKAALQSCDLVIVSDSQAMTDTSQYADVCFPATTWAEKDGTVTNSERFISRQRGYLLPPGDAKHDWQAICEVAKRLGFEEAFNYENSADIFREHAALSGFENDDERDFDISLLSQISNAEYHNLTPIQWPVNARHPNGRSRFFDDGRFYTADKKANLIAVQPRLPTYTPNSGQVTLNTGRIRDQWHTMTRTGKSARLLEHIASPTVQIHPETARQQAIANNALVKLSDRGISYIARAEITESVRADSLFIPMHWNDMFASHARANSLVRPISDALSGQPEFKHSPVTITPLVAQWQGWLMTNETFTPDSDLEWFRTPLANCTLWELISEQRLPDMAWLRTQFSDMDDWVHLQDTEGRYLSAAGFKNNRLCVVLMSEPDLPEMDRNWLKAQIGTEFETKSDRLRLLAGVPADPASQTGRTVCSCYQVGEQTIINAIINGEADSVESLGALLKCGTNCGSCIPELRALTLEQQAKETAA